MFRFLNYLQPTHYFMLSKHDNTTVYPDIQELPDHLLELLEEDKRFSSALATAYDLSWQAIQKGVIGSTKRISQFEPVPLIDEYQFARKYFNSGWVLYVLIVRLLSFYNPFKELSAFYKSRGISRSNYLKNPVVYEDWEEFHSELVQQSPKITVIIPTLNRYKYLKDGLHDLEQQDYSDFEVIVIDQSDPFIQEFYTDFKLDIRVIKQEERALWLARNRAIKLSESDYLLFYDDDSRIAPDWVRTHLKCLDFFNADISSGVSISKVGAKVPEHYSFFRISDQLDTGNVLIKRTVFKTIGLFDRQFEKQRMGDGEFGLRAYLSEFLNVSNPFAQRLHLKVALGGLREMGSWDAFRTNKWFTPRPIPSVLYFFRKYFGNSAAKYSLLRTVPLSIMPYQFKKNKAMQLLGILVSIIILPIIIIQVIRSWQLSTRKLKEGPLIESLH